MDYACTVFSAILDSAQKFFPAILDTSGQCTEIFPSYPEQCIKICPAIVDSACTVFPAILAWPEIQISQPFLDSAYTLFPATVSWSAQKIVRCPGLKIQICSCYTGKCNYSSHPGQPKQIFSIFLARALFYASSQNEGSERMIIIYCLQA